MAKIRVKRNIEIERNIIEQFLMSVKDIFKKNRKLVIYGMLLFLVTGVVSIASLYIWEEKSTSQYIVFEKIMDDYRKNTVNDIPKNNKETIKKLNELIKASHFGFVHNICSYMIGNIYYSEANYAKSKEYLIKFSDNYSSDYFVPLALLKVSSSMEKLNDMDGAIKICKRVEENFENNIILDQLFYNMARLYLKKGDKPSAVKYYKRVISLFPRSPFGKMAKNRLLNI